MENSETNVTENSSIEASSSEADLIINAIESYADEAINTGNPALFLRRISGDNGLHVIWHFRGGRRTYGFLLFHWRLNAKVKMLRPFAPSVVTNLRPADFKTGGRFYDRTIDWNRLYPTGSPPPARTLRDLANFSLRLENWHNIVHGVIERVTGLPMGNASINTTLKIFWELHGLIDALFEQQARSYANASGIQFNSMLELIEHIENQPVQIVMNI